MLTSKRTDVSSHPWVVSYDSSLCRYWGHCYLDDSASTALLRHVLLLLPDYSSSVCFQPSPLLWFKSSHTFDNVFQFLFWSLSNAILKSFSSFSLHHQVFKLKLFSYANLNTALKFSILPPPTPHKWETPSGTGPHSPLSNQKALGSIPTSCLPCGNISLTYDSAQVLFSLGSLAFCGELGSVTPFLGPHSLLTLSCCLY